MRSYDHRTQWIAATTILTRGWIELCHVHELSRFYTSNRGNTNTAAFSNFKRVIFWKYPNIIELPILSKIWENYKLAS